LVDEELYAEECKKARISGELPHPAKVLPTIHVLG
jgi:hypothetical protein